MFLVGFFPMSITGTVEIFGKYQNVSAVSYYSHCGSWSNLFLTLALQWNFEGLHDGDWCMRSSGFRHRVVLWADTDVSKKYSISFFKVELCKKRNGQFRRKVRWDPRSGARGEPCSSQL
jgi:hypothetical protein